MPCSHPHLRPLTAYVDYKCRCPRCTRAKRDSNMRGRYGIGLEEYNKMLYEQDHACAVCRAEFTGAAHVDHCHETGEVRGLLCMGCNSGIGSLGDTLEGAIRAAAYLMGISLR